ncbi:hypothetical protein [Lysobacter sp. A378]
MDKPYVVIHTHTSIDGNRDIMDLPEFREASRQYQERGTLWIRYSVTP